MSRPRIETELISSSPLIITESAKAFDRVRQGFKQKVKPHDIIEQMYVDDIVCLTWEILRLWRSKAAIINLNFRNAVEGVLRHLSDPRSELSRDAKNLSYEWFTNETAKKQISSILAEYQLDETAIEAEAIRKSIADLEQIDRVLASAQLRRDNALRRIAEFRSGFAKQLREQSHYRGRGRHSSEQEISGGSLMISQRKAAANRRNARKSTGPRSAGGKRRASRNAFRHGLTASVISDADRRKHVERLARKIAGSTADAITLYLARSAAAAQLDIVQIRRIKVALIDRILACGKLEKPALFDSVHQVKQFFNGLDRGELILPPLVNNAGASMPSTEPERSAEAMRRALPELATFCPLRTARRRTARSSGHSN